MYRFIYVNGFHIADYEDLLVEHLSLFTHMMGESDYNAVVGERLCANTLHRYRIALHPRVITYTIMRSAPKGGCECSIYAAKAVQHFCFGQFGLRFKDLCSVRRDFAINLFVREFTTRLFAAMRVRLQVVLETKFIKSVDVKHVVDANVSVLNRNTVWHDFAVAIREGLRTVHEPIDTHLTRLYFGVELSAPLRRRIIYLLKNV